MGDSKSSVEQLPYWNVNLPRDQWTDSCPDYLLNLHDDDRAQLALPDSAYAPLSWEEVVDTVDQNQLQTFKRTPSDLHKYRRYIKQIKDSHGSILKFIMEERLHWRDTVPKGDPFEDESDLKILFNDWPYGIDSDIVHLVVWTKFGFQEDSDTGDLTPAARQQIDAYVTRTFRSQLDSGRVLWFKNWTALKSVHAIEHFHVMLYKPDPAFVQRMTH